MKRTFTLLGLTLSFFFVSGQENSANLRFFDDPVMKGTYFNGISSNGRYVVGENQFTNTVYLYDRKTGDMKVLTPPESEKNNLLLTGCSVSDDGTIVGRYTDQEFLIEGEPVPRAAWYKDGAWDFLEALPNTVWNGHGFDGGAEFITGAGDLIGGCLSSDRQLFFYEPTIWRDGKILKRLPLPEEPGCGGKCLAVSADGRIAGGWVRDAMYGGATIWVEDEIFILGDMGRVTNITDNGRFAIGFYQDESTLEEYRSGVPFVWTEEAGFTALPIPEGMEGVEIYGITEDGSRIIGYSLAGFYGDRSALIYKDGVSYNFDGYLQEHYGITPEHDLFTPIDMSKDGEVMCGFTFVDGLHTPWLLEFSNYSDGIDIPESYQITISLDDRNSLLKVSGAYASLEIYNHAGVLCHREKAGDGCTVDMREMARGVYMVKTVYNGKVKVMKVMKS